VRKNVVAAESRWILETEDRRAGGGALNLSATQVYLSRHHDSDPGPSRARYDPSVDLGEVIALKLAHHPEEG
jgi:hypothetical protein